MRAPSPLPFPAALLSSPLLSSCRSYIMLRLFVVPIFQVESLSWHSDNTRDVSWHPHLPLIASFSWDAAVGLWGYSGARDLS